MTIKFLPTLQLIAYVRIAMGIVYSFDLEHLKRSLLGGLQNTEYIEPIKKKISEIDLTTCYSRLSRLTAARKNTEVKIVPLPPQVKKKLGGIIFSLGLEIKLWYECHKFIIEHNFNLDLRNKLSWFSFGVIDRLETAQNFIQDEAFDIGDRFHLACKYCFDDDVQRIWRNMSIADRINAMRRIPRTKSIDLYIESLRRKRSRNWTEISRNERHQFFLGNCLGIRSYFTKLRFPIVRYQCIFFALGSGMAHQTSETRIPGGKTRRYRICIQSIAKKISEIVLPTYCETFSRLTASRRKPEDVIIVHLPPDVKASESSGFGDKTMIDLTARNFIRDDDFDIGERFYLACEYCFEVNVQMFWRNMADDQSNAVKRLLGVSSIEYGLIHCVEIFRETGKK
ncbi:uncharacterized protein TNCV_2472881 [Trichonephila clavipes]|nr:uncharacterized protein TNCV_2472881 [Trichonephila clavipes]